LRQGHDLVDGLVDVDIESDRLKGQVGLENAIGATEGAVAEEVQDPIAATYLTRRARAMLEETAATAGEIEDLLSTAYEVPTRPQFGLYLLSPIDPPDVSCPDPPEDRPDDLIALHPAVHQDPAEGDTAASIPSINSPR
jgi:hypothetical protein